MKRYRMAAILVTLLAALAVPVRLVAQAESGENKHPRRQRYKLIDLGTLGGPQSFVNVPDLSYARVLNNRGMVAGWADTPEPDPFPDFCWDESCFVAHAFRWLNGARKDLGVLPGGASSDSTWITDNGLIAGDSQNGEIDPLVSGFPEIRAVLWKHGQMVDLGTLDGGYESIATSVNSRAQVAGFALNAIPDPQSMIGLGYQTRGFLWQNGAMQDLGTLGTGTNAMAFLVNERGQIAGNSYTSSEPSERCAQAEVGLLTTGAFLWDNGTMKDLGNFGGTCTFAFDLNNRGQVVGGSSLAGDQVQHPFLWDGKKLRDLHTFGGDVGTAIAINDAGEAVGWASYPGEDRLRAALWRHGKVKDLGSLKGYPFSFASDINEKGQVIGFASNSDFSQFHGFLWEHGEPIVDLNSLIPSGSHLEIALPETINDRGEIAGRGVLPDGSEHAFLLIPRRGEDHADLEEGEDTIQDGNATQAASAPVTAPATTPTQPNLSPRGISAGSRARLARRYRIAVAGALAKPVNLVASALNTYQIKLRWQGTSGQSQTGFRLFRCSGCSNPRTQGRQIASLGASVLTYTDGSISNPLTETTAYTHQVTAFNVSGQSGPSNAASVTTRTEPAPTDLASYAFRRGLYDVVVMRWINNSTDNDGYHIERCTGSTCTNFSEIAQVGASATTHIDSMFPMHLTFRYRMRAHSPGGYSGYSNIRTQTTP